MKNLAATFLGLGLAILLAELMLVFVVPPPLRYLTPQARHIPDSDLGWLPVPNTRGYTIDKEVATNSLGLRSDELAQHKTSGTLRVLCLGDSQTFGNGVDQSETYPARLQMLLSDRPGAAPVEVINAGIQGYDTEQEVALLERLAPLLNPDIVTIGVYINDVGEVLRRDKMAKVRGDTGEFTRHGRLKRWIPYRIIYLFKRSRLVTLLYHRWQLFRADPKTHPQTRMLEGRTVPGYEEGWRQVEAALVRARNFVSDREGRLIVIPIPYQQDVLGNYPNEQYRSRLLSITDRLGIESFDPTPTLKAAGGNLQRFFIMWDGHISAKSHELIAHLLSQHLDRPARGIPLQANGS